MGDERAARQAPRPLSRRRQRPRPEDAADRRLSARAGCHFHAYDIGARTRRHQRRLPRDPRLLDRRAAPFGLTLSIVPAYGTVDGSSGAPARSFGTDVALLADRELIPESWSRRSISASLLDTAPTAPDQRALGSGIEAAAALAYQVRPGLFVGAETRYARTYDGLALDRLAGQALYLGPTLYTTLSPQAWASFTWNVQVAGRASGEPGPLDLSDSTVTRCGCASATISEPRPGRAVTFRLPWGEAALASSHEHAPPDDDRPRPTPRSTRSAGRGRVAPRQLEQPSRARLHPHRIASSRASRP